MLDRLSSSGGMYLLLPLLGALGVACASLILRRRPKKICLKTILRVIFNPRIWLHKSALLDYQYVLAGALLFSVGLTYFTIASGAVSDVIRSLLVRMFGPAVSSHGGIGAGIAAGILLYLTYEFAYWLNHYMSHKLPFLWEFHKVHHSAEVLTPFSNWRVHPVDTALFVNTIAVLMGAVQGIIYYTMGKEVWLFSMTVTNMLILFYMTVYGHLQHSLLWLNFRGTTGKVLMSPAHHQIHHSTNPLHYDKNFGAGLCMFDWLFGTHFQPPAKNPGLTLGAGDGTYLKRLVPSIYYPFLYSWRYLYKKATKISVKTDG